MSDQRFPDWQELVLTVATADLDEVLGRLAQLGFEQTWVEQPLAHERGPDGWVTAPADADQSLVHVYTEPDDTDAAARLNAALGDRFGEVHSQVLATEDWLGQWRQGRRNIDLEAGWSLGPPWLADQAPDRARHIIIDPGLAFGAGDHMTTQDCCRLVIRLTRPGDRVLDLGAGSGVLAILALKLGASEAYAVELDRLAHGEILRNGALNESRNLHGVLGDARAADVQGPFDLILANIGAAELRAMAPAMAAWVAPRARLVLSGLVEWAADDVVAAYTAAGWHEIDRLTGAHEWVTVALEWPESE